MSRHIVCTFQGMLILWTILWNQSVEDGFHIHTDIRICILINAQSAARTCSLCLKELVCFVKMFTIPILGSFGNWLRISLVTKWKPLRFGFRIISICCTISLNCHWYTTSWSYRNTGPLARALLACKARTLLTSTSQQNARWFVSVHHVGNRQIVQNVP